MAGRPRIASDDDIFEAVVQVVTKLGPDGATLAAIAAESGLTASALTHRFGSKHGLLVAFTKHAASAAPLVFAAARAELDDPAEAAVEALLRFARHMSDRTSVANNLAFLHRDLTDPELGFHAAEHSREIRRGLTELLSQTGDRFNTTPELLADDLYTTASGAQMTWAIDGDGDLHDWLHARLHRVLDRYQTPPVGPRQQ